MTSDGKMTEDRDMETMRCPVHDEPWKIVPAGISKSTGKPYNSFKACPVKGCTERPPRAPRPNGQGSPSLGQPSAPDARLAMVVACLHFAATLYAGTGASGVEDAKLLAAEMFGNWKEKAK